MIAFFNPKSLALVLALLPILIAYQPFDVTPAIAMMQMAPPHGELLSQRTCKKDLSRFSPSLTPTAQLSALCENDDKFVFFYENKVRTCKNIRINEDRRNVLCSVEEVNAACPQVCGSCCEDDATYIFTRNNGLVGTCSWLGKKQERIDRYCHDIYKPYGNDRTVRDGCSVTCDFCFTGDKRVHLQ